MKKVYLTSLLLVLCATVYAQKDYKKELSEPMVEMIDGEHVIEEFMIIKSKGKSKQLHLRSQMPSDCIVHKDNLIAITTMFMTKLSDEIGGEVEDIDSLIGEADMIIKIYVTNDGMQIAMSAEGETKRETLSWKQFYEEM